MKKSDNYLVFDVGGSNIKYGLIDHSGNLIFKCHFKTPTQSFRSFINSLNEVIDQFSDGYQGLAFSIPGTINHNENKIK